MNSVLGIGEHIVFINKGHCDWTGNDKTIFRSKSESLNDFVFASKLFRKLKTILNVNTKTSQVPCNRIFC